MMVKLTTTYLTIVDCFTDWPDIINMGSITTAFHLIQVKIMRQSFCGTAIPSDVLWSNGGPQLHQKYLRTFQAMGFSLHDFITLSPTKHWQGCNYRKVQHIIVKRHHFSCPEVTCIWQTSTRFHTNSSEILYPRVAKTKI